MERRPSRCLEIARNAAILMLVPALALAHPQGGTAHGGLVAGVLHPLTGIDHLLAMIAVGLWASQLRGRAGAVLPATFPLLMLAGAAMAGLGVGMPAVEPLIALSVLALGVAVAGGIRLPVIPGTALLSVFALAHGHAHGSELPAATDVAAYASGFIGATVLLHLAGLLLGLACRERGRGALVRAGGSLIAVTGVMLLAG
jgi:urease accessory protein